MKRRITFYAALSATVVLGVWGCQDYNFNPVGSCVIQPGSRQVRLDDVSAADILFVVDDSGSMTPKQQELASNFSVFINELTRFTVDRVARGLSAFDYHIAVTTSSVFRNTSWGTCQTVTSGERCCAATPCSVGGSCTAGIESGTCFNGTGGTVCCLDPTSAPSFCDQGAAAHGKNCGHFATKYENPLLVVPPPSVSCTVAGVATPGGSYPQGDFVASGANPKVLHFANLFTNCTVPSPACTPNTACGTGKMCYGGTGATAVCCDDKSATINGLVTQFQQNIQVGCAGSGEEQHLQAARLAVQKALAGQQPGVSPGEWPHANSKMVVVVVADEDDCSNPANPATAILSGNPGSDDCVYNRNPFGTPVEYPVDEYTSFFAGLGRPFGGAFIVSATPVPCAYGTCTPNTCSSGTLVGYAPGTRLLGVGSGLAARGSPPVEGSVCAPFAATLLSIANLVTSPPSLKLDSVPAAGDITLVRIANSASGATRRVCTPGVGWWFYDCAILTTPPPVNTAGCASPGAAGCPSQCIYINHSSGDCEANPGETYSAEYLGQLPTGGCPTAGTPSAYCSQALGGKPESWECYVPGTGAGTCICTGK